MSIVRELRNSPGPTSLDDAMLRWSRGERAAGEFLVQELYPGLRRFVLAKVHPPAGDELVQDALLRLSANKASYIEGRSVKAWVYRIAKNRILDHLRQRARRAPSEADGGDAMDDHHDRAAFTAEDYANAMELDRDIRELLQTIADIDREAFELIVDGHMTVADAAEYVDCGPNAMKFRWLRARQAILAWLARARGGT